MKSVEVTAKTREEAIEDALKQLRAERHEVNVEIVDEGSPGLFGIGARDVCVRVTCEGDDEPEEQPPERKAVPPPKRRPRPERRPKSESRPRSESRSESQPESRPAPERAPKPKPEREAAPKKPVDPARGNEAAALLQEMIGHMGMEATVTSGATDAGDIRLAVESPDSAILIGRKGRNLNSMQYLINRMMAKADGGDEAERILVDVEGYHERRQASLEEMAQRMAARVKESGRRMRLKPLNPQERRVIHLTLQEDPDVRTFSVGSDSLVKSVIIAPADERNDSDRPRRGGRPRRSSRPRQDRGRSDRSSSDRSRSDRPRSDQSRGNRARTDQPQPSQPQPDWSDEQERPVASLASRARERNNNN